MTFVAQRHDEWDAASVEATLAARDYKSPRVLAFAQNQRDEVRDLGDLSGALQAQPGMKQQTYVATGVGGDVAHTLTATGFDASEDGTGRGTPVVAFSCKDNGRDATDDLLPTLRAMNHTTSHMNGGGQVAIAIRTAQTGANGHGLAQDVSHTLDSAGVQAVAIPILEASGRRSNATDSGLGVGHDGDPMYTLQATQQHGVMAFDLQQVTSVANRQRIEDGRPAPTLHQAGGAHAIVNTAVRRLTPTETLRLQGFPDDHLDLDPSLSDSAKYRMTGNAVTVNVAEYLGRNLYAAMKGATDA